MAITKSALHVSIDKKLNDNLYAYSIADKRTRSAVIEILLEEWLKDPDVQNKIERGIELQKKEIEYASKG